MCVCLCVWQHQQQTLRLNCFCLPESSISVAVCGCCCCSCSCTCCCSSSCSCCCFQLSVWWAERQHFSDWHGDLCTAPELPSPFVAYFAACLSKAHEFHWVCVRFSECIQHFNGYFIEPLQQFEICLKFKLDFRLENDMISPNTQLNLTTAASIL